MNLDFADVRVARCADTANAQRADDAPTQFQRHSGEVVHVVVDVGLMKMRRRPGKHALHILASQQVHVAQRVDALDLQLAHRLAAHATVRAIGMSLHLSIEPVDRRITLRARALGRTGVF